MGDKTKIEWTDATWNPIRGCSVVSEGCRNCYAMRHAARFSGEGLPYEGLAYRNESGAHWTGKVRLIDEHLEDPLRWKRPRKIFVNSMSDLFHESIPDEWIDRIFAVMALAPQHTFQILTKRPERMRKYFIEHNRDWDCFRHALEFSHLLYGKDHQLLPSLKDAGWFFNTYYDDEGFKDAELEYYGLLPLPNVWLGVSVEDQKTADQRIPILLNTPAAVRWISAEPLLGEIDLTNLKDANVQRSRRRLDWVVAGGETGPRPMHPDWVRKLRDYCAAAGSAFFFKQWGDWRPEGRINSRFIGGNLSPKRTVAIHIDGTLGWRDDSDPAWSKLSPYAMQRVGKKAAGRLLDGREWNEFPSEILNLKSEIAAGAAQ